jgi:hypothetical protein
MSMIITTEKLDKQCFIFGPHRSYVRALPVEGRISGKEIIGRDFSSSDYWISENLGCEVEFIVSK